MHFLVFRSFLEVTHAVPACCQCAPPRMQQISRTEKKMKTIILNQWPNFRFRMPSGSISVNLLYCWLWEFFYVEVILGFLWVCLSVCNSSACSQQSLSSWTLPQHPQHAGSSFREILPQEQYTDMHVCSKTNIPILPSFCVCWFSGLPLIPTGLYWPLYPVFPTSFMSMQCAVVAVNSSPGHILLLFAKAWQFPNHIMWVWKASSMQCNSIKHSRGVFSHSLCGKVCKHAKVGWPLVPNWYGGGLGGKENWPFGLIGLDMIKQNHVWLWSTELMIMFSIFDGKVTEKDNAF